MVIPCDLDQLCRGHVRTEEGLGRIEVEANIHDQSFLFGRELLSVEMANQVRAIRILEAPLHLVLVTIERQFVYVQALKAETDVAQLPPTNQVRRCIECCAVLINGQYPFLRRLMPEDARIARIGTLGRIGDRVLTVVVPSATAVVAPRQTGSDFCAGIDRYHRFFW